MYSQTNLKGRKIAIRDYKAFFLQQLKLRGFPIPEAEVMFAKPRRWRWDFAYTDRKIAIEYQGGIFYSKQGHNSIKGLRRDYEKFTEGSLRGWVIILIDAETVRSGQAVLWVERALRKCMSEV